MIKALDTKTYLQDYIKGKINLTPILNILMNFHEKDYYEELGKYLVEKGALEKIIKIDHANIKKCYSAISILFIHEHLAEKVLDRILGNKLEHKEFGEGKIKGKRNIKFVSYFGEINGIIFHIGFDHKGTSLEVEESSKPEEIFNILKIITDEVFKDYDNN